MKEINGIKLYDVKELCELMGVGSNSIYLYISKGKLKSTKLGRKRYVSEENLSAYLKGE